MAGLNKAQIIGNIGKVEIRATKDGGQVVSISVATSYKAKDGNDVVEWHNIIFFSKLADVAAQYLKKGMKVYIEGQLKTEKYQAKDGTDRYTTKIIAQQMQMLDKKEDGQQQTKTTAPTDGGFPDDDIPF